MGRPLMRTTKQVWGGAFTVALVSLVLLLWSTGDSSAQDDEADKAPAKTDSSIVRFGHELHKGKGVAVDDCQSCHGIKGFRVEPVTRGKDHQPCNNTACHASEYMSREPKICVVCHDSADPWVKQTARIRDLDVSEFGGDISHKTHQSNKAREGGIKCASCHGDVFAQNESKPDAHAVCGSCHQGGLRPLMSDCGDCHKLGYQEKLRKGASSYNVRDRFEHSDHDSDPREKGRNAPDCKVCHSDVAKATTLAEIPSPTMQSCDACHDGKLAFKTTGFGCVKCHGQAAP